MSLPLTPPYDRYIVEMLPEREQVTEGGLILAPRADAYLTHISEPGKRADLTPQEDKKGDVRYFKVVARGPGLWESGTRQPMQYEVGQEILALKPMEMDGFDWMGRRYYVLAETSVVAGLV